MKIAGSSQRWRAAAGVLPILAGGLLGAGCASTSAGLAFRQEALTRSSFVFGCPATEIAVADLAPAMVGVRGCGQRRIYLQVASHEWIDDTVTPGGELRTLEAPTVQPVFLSAPDFATEGLARAVFEMSCPASALTVVSFGSSYEAGVYGCGLKAIYACYELSFTERFWRPRVFRAM